MSVPGYKNIQIPLEYALCIESLTQGTVSWKELVPVHTVRLLRHLSLSVGQITSYPCIQVRVSLHRIQQLKNSMSETKLPHPNISLGLDENNRILFGEELFYHYQTLGKKTIPAWRFSLPNLLIGKYKPTELVQALLINERAALGVALKKYLGNRQGERSDLKHSRNFDQVTGRTDQWMATLLGFGCKDSYCYAETIHLRGSSKLIQFVNEQKLSLSTAAILASQSYEEQEKILACNKKEIIAFTQQLKQRAKRKVVINPFKEI